MAHSSSPPEPFARVTRIRYPGRPRIGLLATCQCGERTYEVSLADVVFPHASAGARLVSRYRAWLGFDAAVDLERPVESPRPHKVASDAIAVGKPVELAVLACKSNALRCRLLGSAHEVTLRTAVRDEIPGSIITVTPTKRWTHARHPYLSGTVERTRVDVAALGLVPLALRNKGEWDPGREYGGKAGEPIDDWAKLIIARGKRPRFEMEQVIPGADPDDFDSDPIVEAGERNQAGDRAGAREILMKLLAQDLRCLDAHAHLGNFAFDHWTEQALQHYEVGVAIGALSLGTSFEGVLPWGLVDNRPFLRSLHGAGIARGASETVAARRRYSRRCCGSTPATIRARASILLPSKQARRGRRWRAPSDDATPRSQFMDRRASARAPVHAMMPSALQLFAEGRLPRVDGAPVEVVIGGRALGPMVLAEVRCGGESYRHDVAVLVFKHASPGTTT